MPSKNMLPKGHRHRSVRAEYVATRGTEPAAAAIIPTVDIDLHHRALSHTEPGLPAIHTILAPTEAAGLRLDQYLAQAIPDISRSRVQLLIDNGQVHVNGAPARPKHKLTPGETIILTGSPRPAPLNAVPEDISLDIVFEDEFLAIVNKPAGMMVHAGAAAPALASDSVSDPDDLASQPDSPHAKIGLASRPESPQREDAAEEPASLASKMRHDPRSSGTLVNALLHHFNHNLSAVGGDLRPGIVHRLDKQTSGLLIVAKDDITHRKLGDMFSVRTVHKTYIALVHGHIPRRGGATSDDATVTLPIGRDIVRRTRMTTRRSLGSAGVRFAISHIHVVDRLSTPHGPFTLIQVTIETGRTHQIRVHLQALGHPVVGDHLYGAPHQIRPLPKPGASPVPSSLSLPRNFLHATRLVLTHPRTGKPLSAEAPLPPELTRFLAALEADPKPAPIESTP